MLVICVLALNFSDQSLLSLILALKVVMPAGGRDRKE